MEACYRWLAKLRLTLTSQDRQTWPQQRGEMILTRKCVNGNSSTSTPSKRRITLQSCYQRFSYRYHDLTKISNWLCDALCIST